MPTARRPDRRPPAPRLGPRPLSFHLLSQATALFTSQLALPNWRNGSVAWKPHLRTKAEELRAAADGVDPEAFAAVVEAEARHRLDGFLRGIEAYRHHPYRREAPAVPVVWQEGTTRLLDYGDGQPGGAPVLVVPSLINRAYVLDLAPRKSLMRTLAVRGLRPFLVDWDRPGPIEKDFGVDDYVVGRLGRALDAVLRLAGPPAVVGYCMGGLLSLALCILRQAEVRGLALLATPWDFHVPTALASRQVAAMQAPLADAIACHGELPVDILQGLFSTIDPGSVERKFRAFAALKPESRRARDFVALEDWVNDGVPLAARVARECLFDWYVDNLPAAGRWRVGGACMAPAALVKPALVMVPANDRIVPPTSALALAEALPKARRRIVDAGHIGMVAGARAKTDVYTYVAKWLIRIAGH